MPEESEEEKLEFLKREEIRTMEKDIRRLREMEAEKEREKIAALKKEVKEVEVKPEVEALPEEALIPKPPKKKIPGTFKKILVRLGIFLLSIFLISFFYWFFEIRNPPVKEVLPPEEITPPEEERPSPEEMAPEIPIPASLIPIEEIRILEVSKNEEIPDVLNQLMKEELIEGFTRIVIKNKTENKLVSIEDLAEAFQIEVPEGIFQKFEENYTLSVFVQKEGKRMALIAEVKEKEELLELFKNWEAKISKEGVFISGEKIQTLVPYFKTAFFQKIGFRYLTISKEDLGICYAWFDDYFVLTTSFESMKKIIEQLKKIEGVSVLEEKIGQLFIVGFEGKTVTSKLESFLKKYKPGGVLLLSKNIESREQLKKLISDLQSLSLKETGFPLFIAVDQEGDPLSRIGFLEEKTPQSEIENIDQAYQIGLRRGGELKELGVNLNLAPVLDAMKEGDFYFNRTFQKSVKDSGELAKSLILGQKEAGILSAIKHFPGYVGIPFNPENKLAEISLPEISQFKKAMEAKPDLVMASNVIYKEIDPSLPFTFSPKSIQFLKENLGSEILIISDDLDQNSLLEKFSLKEILKKPTQAGVDILIFSGYRLPVEQGLDNFFEAVKNKEISETRINEAVSKVIQLKQKLLK